MQKRELHICENCRHWGTRLSARLPVMRTSVEPSTYARCEAPSVSQDRPLRHETDWCVSWKEKRP